MDWDLPAIVLDTRPYGEGDVIATLMTEEHGSHRGLVRGGAGTALVGNPEQVAGLMKEYAALGIDTFILSGYPHLEESYRFAELVFPLLPREQKERTSGPLSGPFGEIVGTSYLPRASQS